MLERFDSLFDLMDASPDEQACVDHLRSIRWRGDEFCPRCGAVTSIDRRGQAFTVDQSRAPSLIWPAGCEPPLERWRDVGHAQIVPGRRPMSEDTWFDLSSLAKVIFTTERILAMAAEGHIDLDASLVSALPEFRQYDPDNWERKVTFRRCLGHQTPFPAVFPLYRYARDPDLLRAFVLRHAWAAGPAFYSGINFTLLGLAVERLEGRSTRELDPRGGLRLVGRPGAGRRDRGRHLMAPRPGRRGARRQLLGAAGGRPRRPAWHGGSHPRLPGAEAARQRRG